MLSRGILVVVLFPVLVHCRPAPSSDVEPSNQSPEPLENRPVRQGFTQPPPRDAEWLPPPPPPLFEKEELDRLAERPAGARLTEAGEREILGALESIEARSGSEAELASAVSRLREILRRAVLEEGLPYDTAEEFQDSYLFPNDVTGADARHRGRPILLEGRVAPSNMLNPADGFKLFQQEPYVQDPVLLATHHEFTFVRCHLLAPQRQPLRDWQEVQMVGIVEGKVKSDVVIRRCVVL